MHHLLLRVPHKKFIQGNIYEINITGYGPADIGPYAELKKYVGTGSGLECHHIVEVEHLKIIKTLYFPQNAPSVAIPEDLHRKLVSPRFTAEMNYLGGRYGGIATNISKAELLDIYKQVYTWHTSFRELYLIAQEILK